ncbi:MAG: hypothetical protein HRT47_11920 [Candidatus Caenarcaniphilales bacterium]|nr:hypothetical protein [Candidatus Caenarcaniphilales bacterium]
MLGTKLVHNLFRIRDTHHDKWQSPANKNDIKRLKQEIKQLQKAKDYRDTKDKTELKTLSRKILIDLIHSSAVFKENDRDKDFRIEDLFNFVNSENKKWTYEKRKVINSEIKELAKDLETQNDWLDEQIKDMDYLLGLDFNIQEKNPNPVESISYAAEEEKRVKLNRDLLIPNTIALLSAGFIGANVINPPQEIKDCISYGAFCPEAVQHPSTAISGIGLLGSLIGYYVQISLAGMGEQARRKFEHRIENLVNQYSREIDFEIPDRNSLPYGVHPQDQKIAKNTMSYQNILDELNDEKTRLNSMLLKKDLRELDNLIKMKIITEGFINSNKRDLIIGESTIKNSNKSMERLLESFRESAEKLFNEKLLPKMNIVYKNPQDTEKFKKLATFLIYE